MDTGKNLFLRELNLEMCCLVGLLGTALHSGILLQLVSARQAAVYGCLRILPLGFGYRPNYFLLYSTVQIEAFFPVLNKESGLVKYPCSLHESAWLRPAFHLLNRTDFHELSYEHYAIRGYPDFIFLVSFHIEQHGDLRTCEVGATRWFLIFGSEAM